MAVVFFARLAIPSTAGGVLEGAPLARDHATGRCRVAALPRHLSSHILPLCMCRHALVSARGPASLDVSAAGMSLDLDQGDYCRPDTDAVEHALHGHPHGRMDKHGKCGPSRPTFNGAHATLGVGVYADKGRRPGLRALCRCYVLDPN